MSSIKNKIYNLIQKIVDDRGNVLDNVNINGSITSIPCRIYNIQSRFIPGLNELQNYTGVIIYIGEDFTIRQLSNVKYSISLTVTIIYPKDSNNYNEQIGDYIYTNILLKVKEKIEVQFNLDNDLFLYNNEIEYKYIQENNSGLIPFNSTDYIEIFYNKILLKQ